MEAKNGHMRDWGLALPLTVWILFVSVGMSCLWWYENRPGARGDVPQIWPDASEIVASSHKPTLLMFAHPHCSCSRASLEELSKLLVKFKDGVDAKVIFYTVGSSPELWASGSLWKTAKSLPGVNTLYDHSGVEATRFGARTSGHTILYDSKGRLQFSGGITPSRAHAGDSKGQRALISILRSELPQTKDSMVFGCEISDSSEGSVNKI